MFSVMLEFPTREFPATISLHHCLLRKCYPPSKICVINLPIMILCTDPYLNPILRFSLSKSIQMAESIKKKLKIKFKLTKTMNYI